MPGLKADSKLFDVVAGLVKMLLGLIANEDDTKELYAIMLRRMLKPGKPRVFPV